jgi:hypothetical protein
MARVVAEGMPNHIHLVAVPSKAETLMPAIGEAHRHNTRRIISARGGEGIYGKSGFRLF